MSENNRHTGKFMNITKGRDWYDFIWYLSQNTPVNLLHLKERLVQSHAWDKKRVLDKNTMVQLLLDKIDETDFVIARQDVSPFVKDSSNLEIWTKDFFKDILNQLQIVNYYYYKTKKEKF